MRADLLAGPFDGLDEALEAVDAFDRALVAGLLRPQPAGWPTNTTRWGASPLSTSPDRAPKASNAVTSPT
ncbi:hypothetical protein AB0D58_23775, partial [Streptomyces sp. NPDC048210]